MYLACAHPTCQGGWDIISRNGRSGRRLHRHRRRRDLPEGRAHRLHGQGPRPACTSPSARRRSAELLGQLAGAVETLEKDARPAVAVGVGPSRHRGDDPGPRAQRAERARARRAEGGRRAGGAHRPRVVRGERRQRRRAGRGLAGRGTRGEPRPVRDPRHRRRRRARLRRADLDGAQRLRGRDRPHPGRARRASLRMRLVGLPGDDRRRSRVDAARGGAAGRGPRVDAHRPLAARPAGDRGGRARRGRGRAGSRGRRGARGRGRRGRGARPAERGPRGDRAAASPPPASSCSSGSRRRRRRARSPTCSRTSPSGWRSSAPTRAWSARPGWG